MDKNDWIRTIAIILFGLWILPGCASIPKERKRINRIIETEFFQLRWEIYRQTGDAGIFTTFNSYEDKIERQINK